MCLLCGDPGRPDLGPLLPSLQVHLLCLKFSRVSLKASGQPPTEPEVMREVKRIKDKSCVYCKKKGAFVNCGIQVCIVFCERAVSMNIISAMSAVLPLSLWYFPRCPQPV